MNYIAFYLINMKSQYNYFFRYNLISFNDYSTLAEFSVLIIFIQFFGIDFFTMLNSAIQLDLNFNFSRMNLLDKVFVASKISLTYIKSLFIQFSKTIGLFSKVMCLFPQIICFLISMNVTGDLFDRHHLNSNIWLLLYKIILFK